MGAKAPPQTPDTSSSSSSSALCSFFLILAHGSDLAPLARSAATPPPQLAVETGASRQ